MAVTYQRLEGLTGAEFKKAEKLYRWAARVQVGLALAAAVTIFVTDTKLTIAAAIVAAAMYCAWAALDWLYRDSRGQAERGRRALLVIDGLGDDLSPGELRDVEAAFSVTSSQGKAAENPEFFASKKLRGEARLADLIEESGFYSCRLYRLSAQWAWRRLVVSLAILSGTFISSVLIAGTETLGFGARLLCVALVFLVSQEVLGSARAYTRAHDSLGGLQARIRALREGNYPRGDLLLLLGDYNSTVEGAPLMAPGVYAKNAGQLDDLWRRHADQEPLR